MKADANTINNDKAVLDNLPAHHVCPWIVQYILALPLRKLSESPDSIVGPYVQPGMTVVDPGCGFGFFSIPMAKMVGPKGRVVSVDLEPRAIERLKKKAAKRKSIS